MIAATVVDDSLTLAGMSGNDLLELAHLKIARERRDAEMAVARKAILDEAEAGMDYMAKVMFRAIVSTLLEPEWEYGRWRYQVVDSIGRQGGHPEVIAIARKAAAEIRGLR